MVSSLSWLKEWMLIPFDQAPGVTTLLSVRKSQKDYSDSYEASEKRRIGAS